MSKYLLLAAALLVLTVACNKKEEAPATETAPATEEAPAAETAPATEQAPAAE